MPTIKKHIRDLTTVGKMHEDEKKRINEFIDSIVVRMAKLTPEKQQQIFDAVGELKVEPFTNCFGEWFQDIGKKLTEAGV